MSTFAALFDLYDWRPIRNCPGRYSLDRTKVPPRELVGVNFAVGRYELKGMKDLVHVVALNEGGLISYEKQDRTFIHTLCTQSGFERKLRQLGVSRERPPYGSET